MLFHTPSVAELQSCWKRANKSAVRGKVTGQHAVWLSNTRLALAGKHEVWPLGWLASKINQWAADGGRFDEDVSMQALLWEWKEMVFFDPMKLPTDPSKLSPPKTFENALTDWLLNRELLPSNPEHHQPILEMFEDTFRKQHWNSI